MQLTVAFTVTSLLMIAVATRSTADAVPEPPFAVQAVREGEYFLVSWCYPGANQVTLHSCTETPSSYYFLNTEDRQGRVAVRFNALPLPSPLPVESAEFYLWGSDPEPGEPGNQYSPFRASLSPELNSDPDAQPLWSDTAALTPPPGQPGSWVRIRVRKLIETGEHLYLCFHWLPGTPAAPLPTIDWPPDEFRTFSGYLKNQKIFWDDVYDGNVLARINYCIPDLGSFRVSGTEMPDSFWVSLFDSPDDSEQSLLRRWTVTDSLHLYIPVDVGSGRFLTVNAWRGGSVSPKTPAVQLDVVTSVEDSDQFPHSGFQEHHSLSQNSPNPFNTQTAITAVSERPIEVYDITGRRVAVLSVRGRQSDGHYIFRWDGRTSDGSDAASGIYFYRQQGESLTRKMLLLK